eukprot:TRINITY_DN1390_c0_g1_i1.p1 TRINITY_DN1390_c0_g1~~TRINITY_DN1390_c0_g1_i1.p1  ORF type:complete len:956 (-),score=231.94 TRINITY_DN1390_c0_g1_i1:343-3210(-)
MAAPNRPPPVTPESFYDDDAESNITYDGNKIKGATFMKLISKLTSSGSTDNQYLGDFLLTYRSFASSFELFEALVLRYETARDDEIKIVRLRTLNVLKTWIEKFWFDFSKDVPELSDRCTEFLQGQIDQDPTSKKVEQNLLTKLERSLLGTGGERTITNTDPPKVLCKDRSAPLLEQNAEEIARQITMIEWEIWNDIKPWECLGLAWTSKDKEDKSPNILRMIERFNYVSGWVATVICTTENLKKRIKVTQKFVQIAEKLAALGNFNGCMEVVSGLNRGACYRMKNTINPVEAKYGRVLEHIRHVTDREKSYANMRHALKSCDPPCMPYLGMYLTDLTFIEEGNEDFITEFNLINFFKRRLISETIKAISQYQQKGYNFEVVDEIRNQLFGEKVFDEDVLYECSYWLEPRGGNELPASEKPDIFGGPKKLLVEKEVKFETHYIDGWPFYPRDSPSNIEMEDDQFIVAGTLEKIIERLTHKKSPDNSALLPFLASYRMFASPSELFELLVHRYCMPEVKDPDQAEKYHQLVKTPIYLRVFNLLKSWISNHWYDFANDGALRQQMLDFVNGPFAENSGKFRVVLEQNINKQVEGSPAVQDAPEPHLPDPSINPVTASILDFHPEEIARQLSISSHNLFSEIIPNEIIIAAESGDISETPTIMSYNSYYDQLENWVLEELYNSGENRNTGAVISRFVEIAQLCDEQNNILATKAIILSLEKTFVKKRKEDWGKVGYAERQFFFETKELFKEAQQDKLNAKLKSLQSPSVPLLDNYIEEINKIITQHPQPYKKENMINFSRFKLIGESLGKFQRNQQRGYSFQSVPVFQLYLGRHREHIETDVLLAALPEPVERPSGSISAGSGVVSGDSGSQAPIDTDQLRFFLLDLILNDEDFKSSVSSIVSEVIEEELEGFREEMKELTRPLTEFIDSEAAGEFADTEPVCIFFCIVLTYSRVLEL